MTQIVLGSKTTLNLATDLDSMFAELYPSSNFVQRLSFYGSNRSITIAGLPAGEGGNSYFIAGNSDGTGAAGPTVFRISNGSVVIGRGTSFSSVDGGTLTVHARIDSAGINPGSDNAFNLGTSGTRWATVYAASGVVTTSDGNEKQDIQALTTAERAVAVALKSLVRRFRFKDAVAAKGAAARLHFGVIAQDVVAVFAAAGLDATAYGIFCADTSTDGAGATHTRLGIRYEELLAFIIAAL